MAPSTEHGALRVAIVGGGIGGLACALGLARAGVHVRLFESAPAFQEIGAGISFGLNAQHALEQLGLGAEFQQLATQIPTGQWFQWRCGEGNSDSSSAHALLGETRSPHGNTSCHRAEFLDRLAGLLPQEVARFGHRLETVSMPDAQGLQVLRFKNGEEYRAHVVIGADGIHSKAREILAERKEIGEAKLKWSGTWAYRGLIPTDKFKAAVGNKHGELFATTPQMFLGRDRHILIFPIAKGATINVVGFRTDRSRWPRRPDFPLGDAWTQETTQKDMLDDFAGWGEEMLSIMKCIEKPNKWALHQLSSLDSYTSDGLVLLGDAAHGGVPHQGAMAGQAIEDALFLSRLLSLACISPANVARALLAVDAVRLPRANKVLETSLQAGDVYEYAGATTGADLGRITSDVEARMDWIWFHDHNEEFERAKQWLREQGIVAAQA